MDPKVWWETMPKITKTLFAGSLGVTLAAHFGLLNPYSLIFNWGLIWNKFEIWRLVTSVFFFGKLGFPFLINLYFLYSYSIRLEQDVFQRRPGDYIWMLTICWAITMVCAYFFNLMIVGPILSMAILYTWSSANKDMIVSFYFGTQFPAMYLPWALFGFNILLGGSGMMELMGIFVGHVYFYFKFMHGRDFGGSNMLETPAFVKYYFPDEGQGVSGFGQAPASRQAPREQRPPAWGRGHTLGGQ